jgi:hypothetical protein
MPHGRAMRPHSRQPVRTRKNKADAALGLKSWRGIFAAALTVVFWAPFSGHALSAAADPVTIRVEPSDVKLVGKLDRVQLLVTDHSSAGRPIDATSQAKYQSLNPQILSVTAAGRIAPLSVGKAAVRVKFKEQTVDIPVQVRGTDQNGPVSFPEEVIPVLSKAGCNQGACHGAQFGQGGFKLSLFGYAPEEDFQAIVRQWSQRRISLVVPADSLILKKAVLEVPHGGGRRMHVGSNEFETLRAWIAAGADGPVSDEPRISGITVLPTERLYQLDQGQQLRVVAHYSNGVDRDVTHRTRFDSLGKGIADVSHTGYVTAIRKGQTAIMVRYRGRAKVSLVVSPFTDGVVLSEFTTFNFVDEHAKTSWQKLGLRPSPLCGDEQFIRRAFLASIGTLPTPERVERFLDSRDPDKRTALIDELLGLTGDPKRDIYVESWSALWGQKWGDLLRNNRKQVGDIGMWAFANWIQNSLRENKPMDQFVREILLAQGSSYQYGQANFYKVADEPTDLAETTAQVFLGVRLQCARCHQHPFESFSQTDYYGLAAFFTRVDTKRSSDFGGFGNDTIVFVKSSGSIKHPRTGKVMQPVPLGAAPLDTSQERDLRRPLADWLTSPQNPLFSRNLVNRVWGYLMGVALVEPIDDLRATNPASNPELLDALAEDFVANGYNLRKLMRTIMVSRVFQLSSTATAENAADNRFCSHYISKRLSAEVLLDAIDTACGTQERFSGVPLGTRAIELPDPNFQSYFLDTLGRPQRIVACECERTAEPNLAQVLQLVNGELVHRKLTDDKGRIAQLIVHKTSDEDAFRELYLVTLSRRPTAAEIEHCRTILGAADNRREGLEDILWAIINGREFMFNH